MEHKASTILVLGLRPTRDAPETPGEEGILVMDETLRLLLEEGGPIIRYLPFSPYSRETLSSDLLMPGFRTFPNSSTPKANSGSPAAYGANS